TRLERSQMISVRRVMQWAIVLVLAAAGAVGVLIWMRTVDWSKPLAAGFLGAVIGTLSGGVATGAVALVLAPRAARGERRRQRVESALDSVLTALETTHWNLLNEYAHVAEVASTQTLRIAGAEDDGPQ